MKIRFDEWAYRWRHPLPDDQEWFASNPQRRFRIRQAHEDEAQRLTYMTLMIIEWADGVFPHCEVRLYDPDLTPAMVVDFNLSDEDLAHISDECHKGRAVEVSI